MDPSDDFTPPPSAFRKRSTAWAGALGLLLLLGLLGGVGYWFYRSEPEAPSPSVAKAPPPDAGDEKGKEDLVDLKDLPPVDASDDFVRAQVASISRDPEMARWLKTPGLIRRMVAAIADVADGESPRGTLSFLVPRGEFSVVERHGRTYVDPSTFARYDGLGRAVESIDAPAAVAALRAVEPLCASVWKEIGPPGTTFHGNLILALEQLAKAKVDFDDATLVPKGIGWGFASPEFEGRSALEKQLFRTGPENAVRIRNKALELHKLLGAATPAPATSPPTSEDRQTENASP
jgi:hypothetical protein